MHQGFRMAIWMPMGSLLCTTAVSTSSIPEVSVSEDCNSFVTSLAAYCLQFPVCTMSSDSAGRGPQTQAQYSTQSSQLDTGLRYSFLNYNTQDSAAGYPTFTQV